MESTEVAAYRKRVQITRMIVIAVLLIIWEVTARAGVMDVSWSSYPSQIFGQLSKWAMEGILWVHIGTTLNEMFWGFLLGSAMGIVSALINGRAQTLEKTLNPYILAIYSVPPVALAPLFILWFGLGVTGKIFLIASIVFFLVYLNTLAGVKEVDQDLIDSMRIMGAGEKTIYTRVIIPNAGIWILTGLKQAVPKAITGAIAAEMMAAKSGMGYLIIESSSMLDIGGVLASLVVLLIVGLALTELVSRVERFLLRWKTA